MITSILGGLGGRRVELSEYMSKIAKPEEVTRDLKFIFEELKAVKVNKKLLSLMKEQISKGAFPSESSTKKSVSDRNRPKPEYKTLYDFINEDSVNALAKNATDSYQKLDVRYFSN